MDMRWPPGIVMIAPGIGSGTNRNVTVTSLLVADDAADTREVGIERRRPIVPGMDVPASCVGLPNLNHRVGYRPFILIKHAPSDDDALAQGLTLVLPGHVGHRTAHQILPAGRKTASLGAGLRNTNWWMKGCALYRRGVWRKKMRRLCSIV